MSAYIYLEGAATGADSKYLKAKCQEAFHKLLNGMGFTGRMPRLVACGGRNAVYDRFCTQHSQNANDYVAMWIDSEDLLADLEAAWTHLKSRDNWTPPAKAVDEQVLFMTACMETWLVADRTALKEHYGNGLQASALPPLSNLEQRDRHHVQDQLSHATRNCKNAYAKGKRSFEILGKVDPAVLGEHLPSFARIHRILNTHL